MNRKLKFITYGFIIVFGFLIVGSVIRTEGFLHKAIGIMGMVLVVKGIILLTSRSSEKILSWISEKPPLFFRIWALVILIFGIMLISACEMAREDEQPAEEEEREPTVIDFFTGKFQTDAYKKMKTRIDGIGETAEKQVRELEER